MKFEQRFATVRDMLVWQGQHPLLSCTIRVLRFLSRRTSATVPEIRDAVGTRYLPMQDVMRAVEGLVTAGLIESCGDKQLGVDYWVLYRVVSRSRG